MSDNAMSSNNSVNNTISMPDASYSISVAGNPLIPHNNIATLSSHPFTTHPGTSLASVPTYTSHSNIASYPSSLPCHPNLGNPPALAYQAFVPHPSFVGHPNLNPYPNLTNSQPALASTQPRITTLPSTNLSILPPHATLMQLAPAQPDAVIAANSQQISGQVMTIPPTQVIPQSQQVHQQQQQQAAEASKKKLENSTCNKSVPNSPSTSYSTMQGGNNNKNPNDQKAPCCFCADCFICSNKTGSKGSDKCCVKLTSVMPHSHAPLLVLLADVLGYNVASAHTLHSKVVCSSCFKMLEVIDEVQLTQTKNKADIRRKFQQTVSSKGLSYARGEKVSRSLCRRCGCSLSSARTKKIAPGVLSPKGKKRIFKLTNGTSKPSKMKLSAEEPQEKKCNTIISPAVPEIEPSNSTSKPSLPNSSSTMPLENTSPTNNEGSSSKNFSLQTQCFPNFTSNAVTPVTNSNVSSKQVPQNGEASQSSNNEDTNPLVKIYDSDPAIFSPNERLKVGVMRKKSICESSKFDCHYCSFACESAVSLKMHVRSVHLPVLVYEPSTETPEGKKSYASIFICDGLSADSDENSEEEAMSLQPRIGVRLQNLSTDPVCSGNEKPFVCLFCESAYKLQSSLQSHYRDQHSPKKPFKCTACDEVFRRNIELTRHKLQKCIGSNSSKISPT